MAAPSIEKAYEMGAEGGEVNEDERAAFEAWMRGRCWDLMATWNGITYIGILDSSSDIDPSAMRTRQLWAAWRDRAALSTGIEEER